MAKYGSGLQFIIAGDTNRLNLKPILSLSPAMKQLVQTPTRLNPDAMLDPVITTMKKYYQTPITKPPIQNDEEKKGKPSDHLVVLMYPIKSVINCPSRQVRVVECRPLPQSGINKLGIWLQEQTWKEIFECKNVNVKINDSIPRYTFHSSGPPSTLWIYDVRCARVKFAKLHLQFP